MQTRSVRITVLTLLLALPLAAAVFLWTIDRRAARAADAADVVGARVDRVRDAIAEIGAAQQGYVAPGQLDEPWLERVATQIEALRRDLAAVAPLVQSADASKAVDALVASIDALEAADARARQNLSLGQDLMAADVIFSDGRNILDAMAAHLRDLRQAERAAIEAMTTRATLARWGAFAVLAFLSLALAVRTRGAPGVPTAPLAESPADGTVSTSGAPGTPGTPGTFATSGTAGTSSVDLAAAAALCTDLSRVAETAAITPLFGRAGALLDASGLTLWMSAGDQLFPVLGHGYPAEHLARFGPIARTADNAVAAAWRTGRLSVMAGDERAPGALAAPLFGPDGCLGVLALEIRHRREQDPAVQAVAAMIAAQLATAVAAWPAASGAPTARAPAARTA